jgi:hypothetical protein
MEPKDFEEALARAGELLEQEPPLNRNINRTYSQTVRSAFESVKKARADGFSFTQICGAFVKAGILPGQVRPHSFRQAFYREAKRRDREKELLRRIKGDAGASEKEVMPEPAKNEPAKRNSAAGLTERMKALTSYKEEMGLGTLIKHSDGSFDFD